MKKFYNVVCSISMSVVNFILTSGYYKRVNIYSVFQSEFGNKISIQIDMSIDDTRFILVCSVDFNNDEKIMIQHNFMSNEQYKELKNIIKDVLSKR